LHRSPSTIAIRVCSSAIFLTRKRGEKREERREKREGLETIVAVAMPFLATNDNLISRGSRREELFASRTQLHISAVDIRSGNASLRIKSQMTRFMPFFSTSNNSLFTSRDCSSTSRTQLRISLINSVIGQWFLMLSSLETSPVPLLS